MSVQAVATTQRSLPIRAASALITAATIAGAVFSLFLLLLNVEPPDFMAALPAYISIPLGMPLVAAPLLTGGAAWGALLARLVGARPLPAARTGALTVTGMVVLLEVPVHMSQALPLPAWFPFGAHGAFTLVFMTEVALVSGVASTRLARRLDLRGEPRRIGRQVGLFGALGFGVGSLVAVAWGFVVGEPPSTNMVWALQIGNVAAGLAAGWQLGRHLEGGTASRG